MSGFPLTPDDGHQHNTDQHGVCMHCGESPVVMSPSEVKAAMLYGPAPTGDEDPHASQVVPDPMETSHPPLFATQEVLDSLSPGIKIQDVDGDSWVKQPNGEWQTEAGSPTHRSKTMAALWAPFTVIGMEEA